MDLKLATDKQRIAALQAPRVELYPDMSGYLLATGIAWIRVCVVCCIVLFVYIYTCMCIAFINNK